MSACHCGSGKPYATCCGRLHSGAENAASAEALMRSRYCAYVLGLEPYLLATWHASTRPAALHLAEKFGLKGKKLTVEIRRMKQCGKLIQRRVSAGPTSPKKKVVFNLVATNLTLEV